MSRKTTNYIIRDAQMKTGAYGFEVAKLLGMSESTYLRRMREELPVEEQIRIAELITTEFKKRNRNGENEHECDR